jgi:hypothetical protein
MYYIPRLNLSCAVTASHGLNMTLVSKSIAAVSLAWGVTISQSFVIFLSHGKSCQEMSIFFWNILLIKPHKLFPAEQIDSSATSVYEAHSRPIYNFIENRRRDQYTMLGIAVFR